jgi:hypothetical protein
MKPLIYNSDLFILRYLSGVKCISYYVEWVQQIQSQWVYLYRKRKYMNFDIYLKNIFGLFNLPSIVKVLPDQVWR